MFSNISDVSGLNSVDIDVWLKSVSGPCHGFVASQRSRALGIMTLIPCWDLSLSGGHVGVAVSVGMLYGHAG